ncbi:hypothetical protein IAU60_002039 [Kwoniella sp. DSM 27419]
MLPGILLLQGMVLVSCASAASSTYLYAGCYDHEVTHNQVRSWLGHDYSISCIDLCTQYYPDTAYAYDWVVWGDFNYYPYCWCTTAAPQAEFWLDSDMYCFNDVAVYLTHPADSWKQEQCAYPWSNDTMLPTRVHTVPQCLEHWYRLSLL